MQTGRYISLLFMLLFTAQLGLAQHDHSNDKGSDTMIFGDIKDANGEHIPFANVLVMGTTIGAAADATGHFKLVHVSEGEHTIRAQAVGYKPSVKKVKLEKGKTTEIYFVLEDDAILTDEVVVTASRYAQSRKEAPVVVNTISPELFESTGSPSLAEGLNFVSGLRLENDCQNCGFTQLRLNGLDGPYTQFLINSRPIFSSLAGVYGLEMYPSSMIDRVEVVRGGGSALYGANAIGGTVNILTKDPVSNTFMVGGELGYIDGEAPDATVKFNTSMVTDDYKAGMFVYGMHRERAPYNANPDDTWEDENGNIIKDDYTEMVKLKSTVLGFNSYYRPSERSRITFDFNVINDERRGGNKLELREDLADVAEGVKHTILSGGIAADLFTKNQKGKLSLYTSAQHVSRDSYYGANQDPSAYGRTKGLTAVVGGQLSYTFDDAILAPSTFIIGAENIYDNLDDKKLAYRDIATGEIIGDRPVTKQHVNTIGTYAQNEWDFGWYKLLLGLRYDRGVVSDDAPGAEKEDEVYDHVSPRANLLFKVSEDLQLRLSYGGGFRFPQIFDEDLHIEASAARTVLHVNDPNLKPEKSHNVTGGMDLDFDLFGKKSEFIVEGFYTALVDPFAPEYSTDEDSRVTTIKRINADAKAVVAGANFELRLNPMKDMGIQLGYTLQTSEYSTPQSWGDEETSVSKHILRTPSNYGFFVLNYSPLHDFSTVFTGTYTGAMHIPHLQEIYHNGESTVTETLVKSKDFFDLGVKVAYDFHINKGTCLELSCGVKNIFNSYQNDFDAGPYRDAGYVYGPKQPRTIYFGVKLGNL